MSVNGGPAALIAAAAVPGCRSSLAAPERNGVSAAKALSPGAVFFGIVDGAEGVADGFVVVELALVGAGGVPGPEGDVPHRCAAAARW